MFTIAENLAASYTATTLDQIKVEVGAFVQDAARGVADGADANQIFTSFVSNALTGGGLLTLGAIGAVGVSFLNFARSAGVRYLQPLISHYKGLAKVGDAIIAAGTIITRTRMIPGRVRDGVTGGDSTILKGELLAADGLRRGISVVGASGPSHYS